MSMDHIFLLLHFRGIGMIFTGCAFSLSKLSNHKHKGQTR